MSFIFGIGDGVLISFGIILGAILLFIVNVRSNGLSEVIRYILLAVFFLLLLFMWPIKNAENATSEERRKTDIILIPRVIFLIVLPLFMIYLINLYVRHDLFHVVRAQSTANRHAKPWLLETTIKGIQ